MPKVPSSLALLAAALLAASAAAAAPSFPSIRTSARRRSNPASQTTRRTRKIPSHDWPQFIPGHPTPIFHGDWHASYIDGEGRLRRHPGGGPDYLQLFSRQRR